MGATCSIGEKTTKEKERNGERRMVLILQRKDDFPRHLRLVIEFVLKKKRTPSEFLSEVEDRFVHWLARPSGEAGLDDTIDTPRQVELALRYFPQVLKRTWGDRNIVPIYWLFLSRQKISFVPLFARLGSNMGVFEPHQRGGLVIVPNHQGLVWDRNHEGAPMDIFYLLVSGNPGKATEDQVLKVIQELRNANLMTPTDIQDFDMIWYLLQQWNHFFLFPKEIFLYLVHWNPGVLVAKTDRTELSSEIKSFFFPYDVKQRKSLVAIRMIFGLLLKYYPEDLGNLFYRTIKVAPRRLRPLQPFYSDKAYGEWMRQHRKFVIPGSTRVVNQDYWASPFEVACNDYGRETILSMINDLVGQQIQADANFTRKALVRTAKVCRKREALHRGGISCGDDGLDQLFFLIQRDPTICQKW